MDPLAQRELEMLAQAKDFLVNLWEKTNIFFDSYQWQEIIFAIKFGLIIISLLLLIAIIFLLVKIIILSPLERSLFKSSKKSTPVFSKKKIEKRWAKIEKRLDSGLEANYKLAVLEADKIFDRVLKEVGYGKEKTIPSIGEIKQADKLKNNIVEDKKFKLSKEGAEKVVAAYRRGLEELGIL